MFVGCCNFVGDNVCIEGTFVVGVREVGDIVCIDGGSTGNAVICEIGGLLTGAGVDIGTDTGVVGTLLIEKHSSAAFCSQYSSVTMATSGITRASADEELAGNDADVLHIYRSPSLPYISKGFSN